jgi:TatD DNase family protein
VKHTATYVAGMLGIGFDELAQRTTANFDRLFDKAGVDKTAKGAA